MARNEANLFIAEQQQLIRALKDSLEREKQQLRQLRRLKECLVSTSLKLQVASSTVKCDETTILYLRKDLQEARKQVHTSSEKEAAATELVQSLRLEILQLKQRMRENDTDNHQQQYAGSHTSVFVDADRQVNSMMQGRGVQTAEVEHVPREKDRPTHFQEWKMNKFIWAPDTPGGSATCDELAVQELLHAAMQPNRGTGIYKLNKATIVKQRMGSTTGTRTGGTQYLPGLKSPVKTSKHHRAVASAYPTPFHGCGTSTERAGGDRHTSPITRNGRPSSSIV